MTPNDNVFIHCKFSNIVPQWLSKCLISRRLIFRPSQDHQTTHPPNPSESISEVIIESFLKLLFGRYWQTRKTKKRKHNTKTKNYKPKPKTKNRRQANKPNWNQTEVSWPSLRLNWGKAELVLFSLIILNKQKGTANMC